MKKGDFAMTDVKVISVNPGKKTLGAINSEFIARVARTCRPVSLAIHTPRFKTVWNAIFGISKTATTAGSTKLLLIRCLVAVLLITTGVICIMKETDIYPPAISVFNIIAGSMIFLGFFARIASLSGFALYAYIATVSIFKFHSLVQVPEMLSGNIAPVALALTFLILAITGPGRYCIDQILRKNIFRICKRLTFRRAERKKHHAAENRLSYKAWRESDP